MGASPFLAHFEFAADKIVSDLTTVFLGTAHADLTHSNLGESSRTISGIEEHRANCSTEYRTKIAFLLRDLQFVSTQTVM